MSDPREARPDPSDMRFGDAMSELEKILTALEDEQLDLDELGTMVERAADLIRHCRGRIVSTELRVKEVVQRLQTDLRDPDTEAP